MKRYRIDPANFSDGQWEELYNASTIMPRTYENRSSAKPFKRARGQVELAIQCLYNKADRMLDGELGPENHRGENEEWALDLRHAAAQLEELIGHPHASPEDARKRLLDLLQSDIWTEASEYADRVAEIQTLIPRVFGGRR